MNWMIFRQDFWDTWESYLKQTVYPGCSSFSIETTFFTFEVVKIRFWLLLVINSLQEGIWHFCWSLGNLKCLHLLWRSWATLETNFNRRATLSSKILCSNINEQVGLKSNEQHADVLVTKSLPVTSNKTFCLFNVFQSSLEREREEFSENCRQSGFLLRKRPPHPFVFFCRRRRTVKV